jgi:hypothetical protein
MKQVNARETVSISFEHYADGFEVTVTDSEDPQGNWGNMFIEDATAHDLAYQILTVCKRRQKSRDLQAVQHI